MTGAVEDATREGHEPAQGGGAVPLRAPSPRPASPWGAPAWIARLLRPERRRADRFAVAGLAEIDGKTVQVLDVGPGGFRLAGYRGVLNPQDRFAFRLTAQSPPLELCGEAVVAWRRGDKLGAAFYSLPAGVRDALDAVLRAAAGRGGRAGPASRS